MEIQQHDGVVVDATGKAVGLRQGPAGGGRGVTGGEVPGAEVRLPSLHPTIYRGQGGAGPRRWDLLGGRRPGGRLAPQGKGGAPHP